MKVRQICCVLLLAAWGSPLGAGELLTIKVSPTVAFAPSDLTVRAHVEANANNRALEISVDSPDFYRSSLIELHGESAPRTSVFEWRDIPRGRYVVTATLFGPAGQTRSLARETINVISRAGN